MRKIVITGGAGFIGSHVSEHICKTFPDSEVVILDKMTYAGDINYILDLIVSRRARLIVGDICDYELVRDTIDGCDLLIHTAAESHVDRSFHSSIHFTQTNALGTHTIMEACRDAGVSLIIHVSTDEVYGEVLSGACDESSILNPTNPYSASKAAAEMIVNGYIHSFNLPVIIVRANNIFGIRQFPEKLVPRCIMSLITCTRFPVHGNGTNIRHYLSVYDFAEALSLLVRAGEIHEVYNIGAYEEFSNVDVVRMICREFNVDFDTSVAFVRDRPFNDRRYSINWDKLTSLGWSPNRSLEAEIPEIVAWYRDNAHDILKRMELLGGTAPKQGLSRHDRSLAGQRV